MHSDDCEEACHTKGYAEAAGCDYDYRLDASPKAHLRQRAKMFREEAEKMQHMVRDYLRTMEKRLSLAAQYEAAADRL